MSDKQYAYSRDQETFYGSEETVEGALSEAENDDPEQQEVFIGECSPMDIEVCPRQVIEAVAEQAVDHAGEAAMDWLGDIDDDTEEKLGILLTDAFKKWLQQTDAQPNFYGVTNTKLYKKMPNGKWKPAEA